jgi:hypothetical protein
MEVQLQVSSVFSAKNLIPKLKAQVLFEKISMPVPQKKKKKKSEHIHERRTHFIRNTISLHARRWLRKAETGLLLHKERRNSTNRSLPDRENQCTENTVS